MLVSLPRAGLRPVLDQLSKVWEESPIQIRGAGELVQQLGGGRGGSAVQKASINKINKLNILSFALASDAGDRTTPVSDQRDCPPPPPALLTQDSMPRERRHLAGVTWEGGLAVIFLFCSRGNVLSTPMAF